jgi:drug/metabolite transporter (DMT)-like permease
MVLGACGDFCLKCAATHVGTLTLHNWSHIFLLLANPWEIAGILLLMGFMACYLTALSWADLTFVLPATAVGYIIMAGLAKFFLHETITPKRWIGILLITAGVGFVAGGPSVTTEESSESACEGIAAGESR